VAETSAGGLVAATLIGIAGASAWFVGGVIPYAASTRLQWLGVGEEPLGAVSAEMARALAEAVRARTGAIWGVGETGIAGPQLGRRSRKPSGLGFVAVAGPTGTFTQEVTTSDVDRRTNQVLFATSALSLLARCIVQPTST
jgi:nicotinamide-nucleotide amidase